MTTAPSDRPAGSIDPKLLEILVCPLTKGPLEYDTAKQELISRSAKLAYPIRDGIPIMLPEQARTLARAPRCHQTYAAIEEPTHAENLGAQELGQCPEGDVGDRRARAG